MTPSFAFTLSKPCFLHKSIPSISPILRYRNLRRHPGPKLASFKSRAIRASISARTTDARGFLLPEEGDVVLYQGRWANEDAAGLVSSVRYIESRAAHIVDVVELRRLSSDLFAVPNAQTKRAKWMDVAEVRVAQDAVYVPAQDAYRVGGTRDGYAQVTVNEEDRRKATEQYNELKKQLLQESGIVGIAGSVLGFICGGAEFGEAFTLGAVASVLYVVMLQSAVDRIGKRDIMSRLLGLRFLVPVIPFALLAALHGGLGLKKAEALGAVLGLLVYKVPILVRTGGEFVDGLAEFEMGKTGMLGTAVGLAARQIKKRRERKQGPEGAVQAAEKNVIFVFAGPSGVGKSTLINKLMQEYGEKFSYTVSHTTRQKRAGEEDGRDYNFVDAETFEAMIAEGAFVEFAKVHGQYYGTSYAAVEKVSECGGICVLDLDVQGVQSLRERAGLEARYVWVAPPSVDALQQRLLRRGTEGEKDVQVRMDTAIREMAVAATCDWFDLVLVNDEVDRAYVELREFIRSVVDLS